MRDSTGPVDILVNNAGSGVRAFQDGDRPDRPFVGDDARRVGARHRRELLRRAAHVTHTLPARDDRARWGRILTIVSDAGRKGERSQAVYGAAKAGGHGLHAAGIGRRGRPLGRHRQLHRARHHPSRRDDRGLDAGSRPATRRSCGPTRSAASGRLEDPAPLAVLLCSDAGEWITGQVYPVNGGYTSAL